MQRKDRYSNTKKWGGKQKQKTISTNRNKTDQEKEGDEKEEPQPQQQPTTGPYNDKGHSANSSLNGNLC